MPRNPSRKNDNPRESAGSTPEIEELRQKVRELEETLDAIRSGEVDAIIVSEGDARQVYTLEGADLPYRALVENIREGALTLTLNGMILYTNTRFTDMVKIPADRIPGTSFLDYVCPEHRAEMEEALREILRKGCRTRLRLRQGGKGSLPVLISMNPLGSGGDAKISVVVTDRRKDEDQIVMQARMLDAVGDAVIAADTKNRIIYWNDAASRTYGWKPDEVMGHDLIDVATPEISRKEATEIADRLRKGATWSGEYTVRHRDGHEFPIHAIDAPVFDDDGRLIAIIGASHDISERKRDEQDLAEKTRKLSILNEDLRTIQEELQQSYDELQTVNENLRRSEEELRKANENLVEGKKAATRERDRVKNLLDIAGVMILALDTKGMVTMINRRGSEILGLSEEEIIGKDWILHFLPGKIRRKMKTIFNRILAGEIEKFRSYENPVLTGNGDERDILWSNALIRDAGGRVTGILSSGEDITDRKKTESALRESEDRFRSVLDNSRDFIYRVNVQTGHYEYVSPSVIDVLGYTPEEFAAMDPGTTMATVHPEDQPVVKGVLKDLETSGAAEVEYRLRNRKGEYRYVSNILSMIPDSSGSPLFRDGTVRDITNRRHAEEILREKNLELNTLNEQLTAVQEELRQNVEELSIREKLLNEALAEKEVLLAEIHHRVKNNLTAFISLLSLEGASVDTPEGRELKKDLQNRARSMALIHDTLYRTRNFSKVDMDVYLSTLVGQIAASYTGGREIRITVDAHGMVFDLARATTAGLIINELITNSYKYAFPPAFDCRKERGEPCTIRVTLGAKDGSLILSVADNGRGLPHDLDPHSSRTLGLRLVNFLARHQLRAKIEIHKEKGTEFYFRLDKTDELT